MLYLQLERRSSAIIRPMICFSMKSPFWVGGGGGCGDGSGGGGEGVAGAGTSIGAW